MLANGRMSSYTQPYFYATHPPSLPTTQQQGTTPSPPNDSDSPTWTDSSTTSSLSPASSALPSTVLPAKPSQGSFDTHHSRDFSVLINPTDPEPNLAKLSVHSRHTSSSSLPTTSKLALSPPQSTSHHSEAITTHPPHTLVRRASIVSSASSSSTAEGTTAGMDKVQWAEGSKGVRDPSKPARRKAPRIGSFETAPPHSTETDDEHEPIQEPASSDDMDSRPSTADSPPPSTAAVSPPPSPPANAPPQRTPPAHVDIVSYPSAELLRLLASLLEQIAHANDNLNQRASQSRSNSNPGSGSNTPGAAVAAAAAVKGKSTHPTKEENEDSNLERGRFDAAPLNSPVTPQYAVGQGPPSDEAEPLDDMLPVTPGVDLLREVGEGGGAEGFMPSLGGVYAPMPLARRRGSSFLGKHHESSSSMSRNAGSTNAMKIDERPLGEAEGDEAESVTSSTALEKEPPLTSLLTASSLALSSPSATLCFHARNIPAISIEAYLLRILKYCPTTNEVFLSLLVYFDRMARVGLEAQRVGLVGGGSGIGGTVKEGDATARLFAIDSFNVHRLVIAGVTVASKFFSDVFYTNSRYAKVGGLPLNELNQLELQFLLLNDFRLVIPVDELQRYADQLILFWIGRNGSTASSTNPHPHPSTTTTHPQLSEQKVGAPITSFPFPNANASTPTKNSTPNLTAVAVAESMKLASELRMRQAEEADHRQRLNSYSFDDPHSLHSSTSSSSPVDPYTAHRPHSIRSQPSSSGTSVTSTITPGSGTPTTPQGTISEREDIIDDQDEGDDTDGEEGQLEHMRAGTRREDGSEERRGLAMDES